MKMIKLRNPSEVILRNGKTLEVALELHYMWLKGEKGGEKVNLSCENLSYTDLSYATLSYADLSFSDLSFSDLSFSDLSYSNLKDTNLNHSDLSFSDLSFSDLSYSDLSFSDFKYTNLNHSDLSFSDLKDTDLRYAKFYLTDLYKTNGDFTSVGNIGYRNDTTHYFYNIDKVVCGCFDGTMEEFENKVKDTYEEDIKEYKEYMVAIRTLKELAEINK